MRKISSIVTPGDVYSSWVVRYETARRGKYTRYVSCKCKCGVISEVSLQSLRSRQSTQCRACSIKSRIKIPHNFKGIKSTTRAKDKVKVTCNKCQVNKFIEFRKLKSIGSGNYRCTSCAHGGDGSGIAPLRRRASTTCTGCDKEYLVRRDAIIKLKSRKRSYKCPTCNIRGDGVGSETPLSLDRVKVICKGCAKESHIFYKDLKARSMVYRCVTCAIRGDGVGSETPKSVDYVATKCRKCEKEYPVQVFNLKALGKRKKSYTCRVCAVGGASEKEQELATFLEELANITIEKNTTKYLIDSPRNKEIDLYLPKYKIGIEYNGLIWHSERFKKDSKYHMKKRLLAEKQNIRLIQVNSDEWSFKQPIVESILKQAIGLTKDRYYARKLRVSIPGTKEAQTFLDENHLMGKFRAGRVIGLYHGETLVQLMVYKLLKSKSVLDCARICGLRDTSVVGGVSRLLSHAVKLHSGLEKIISFVDLRYATGNSLSKLGFKRKNTTLGWKWTDGKHTYNRLRCRANMDGRKLTQAQHAEELKWYKLFDAGQAKFVLEL